MGLLSKKVKCTCSICGRETKVKEKKVEGNGEVACDICRVEAMRIMSEKRNMTSTEQLSFLNQLTFEETKRILDEEEKRLNVQKDLSNRFNANGLGKNVNVDEVNEIVEIITDSKEYYLFSQITGFELYEDGNNITKGGLGSAVVGNALFGGVGAIVGGITGGKKSSGTVTNLDLVVYFNSSSLPMKKISYISKEIKKKSSVYKKLYEQVKQDEALLNFVCDKNKEKVKQGTANVSSGADEIKKFKELLDMGAITEEEFEIKKKQLLGL